MAGAMSGKHYFSSEWENNDDEVDAIMIKKIMKSKAMKKMKQLTCTKNLNVHLSIKNSVPGSLQNFSPNSGTCQV